MKVRMYNVGFGDFFVITRGHSSLVCDCGSITKTKQELNSIVRTAKEELLDDKKKKLALITHFHSDHTSGFDEFKTIQKNFFDEVFLPYLTVEDRDSKKKILLELAFLMYFILDSTSLSFLLAQNIIKSIETTLELTTNVNIRFLSEGDKFNVDNQHFAVIWPKKVISFDKPLVNKLERLQKELESTKLWALKNQYISLYVQFMEAVGRPGSTDDATAISKSIGRVLEDASKDHGLNPKTLAKVKQILDDKKNTYTLFSRSNNSTSIVFESVGGPASILMTGDIEKKTIEQINFMASHYWAVKAPHHGTDNHYNPKLPLGDFIMISSARCRDYGKVSTAYQRYAHKLCTCAVDHCECAVPCYLGTCLNDSAFRYCEISKELCIKNRLITIR